MVSAVLAAGLLAVCVTASAGAAVTYRSAGGVCETASLYANYSPSGGPKNKIGVVVLGEVVGFVDSNGSWAIVRTGSGGAPAGFVLRECITVPEAGSSGSYLWPAKIACQNATAYANYDSKTHKPEHDFAVLRRGQRIGYQYYTGNFSTGGWAGVRKGHGGAAVFGFVLRECVDVANWAPNAHWNPARPR